MSEKQLRAWQNSFVYRLLIINTENERYQHFLIPGYYLKKAASWPWGQWALVWKTSTAYAIMKRERNLPGGLRHDRIPWAKPDVIDESSDLIVELPQDVPPSFDEIMKRLREDGKLDSEWFEL